MPIPTTPQEPQKEAPKEIIIVIDDPITGRAHIEIPGQSQKPAAPAKEEEAPSNVQPFKTKDQQTQEKKPGAPTAPAQEPAKAASLVNPLLQRQ